MNDSQGTQAQFVATTFATANEWDCATAATVASSGSKWIEWESSSIRDAKDFHFSLRKKMEFKWNGILEILNQNLADLNFRPSRWALRPCARRSLQLLHTGAASGARGGPHDSCRWRWSRRRRRKSVGFGGKRCGFHRDVMVKYGKIHGNIWEHMGINWDDI